MRDDELSHRVVLRALRCGTGRPIASNDKGRRRSPGPLSFSEVLLRRSFAESALVARGVVRVDEAFASRTIEQLRRGRLGLCTGVGRLRLLERCPQGGTLRTVAHGRRARLTHVLLCGCDIRHEGNLQKMRGCRGVREGWNLGFESAKVKAR